MTHKLIITSAATLLFNTACVSLNEPISSLHGKANEELMAAQIVDPAPAEGAPTMDAQKADAAIERYRTDTIKEPAESKSVTFGDSGDS